MLVIGLGVLSGMMARSTGEVPSRICGPSSPPRMRSRTGCREVALSTPGITGILLDHEGMDCIDPHGSAKVGEVLELTNQAGWPYGRPESHPQLRRF